MPAFTQEGLDLIKRWEGFRSKPYLCPAGVLTIGYGHTVDVLPHHQLTEHQAEVILLHDLELFISGVRDLTRDAALNDNQFSALVSFAFNVGLANLRKSTLLKHVLKGDHKAAKLEFSKWVFAAGKRLKGLELRRHAEALLYGSTPVWPGSDAARLPPAP